MEKEAYLSGATSLPGGLPESFESMLDTLESFVTGLKSDKHQWDNFFYRVDLPASVHTWEMEPLELARLLILRSFQKVWLRRHYPQADSKVGPEDAKHP